MKYYKVRPPYGGLLSRSCGGLKGPLVSKVILADGRTDNRFNGVICLGKADILIFKYTFIYFCKNFHCIRNNDAIASSKIDFSVKWIEQCKIVVSKHYKNCYSGTPMHYFQ